MGFTWEQKYEMFKDLGTNEYNPHFGLKMRHPGNWYFSPDCEVLEPGIRLSAYGNGITPEEAVNDCWNKYTNKPVVFATRTSGGPEKFYISRPTYFKELSKEDAYTMVEILDEQNKRNKK